MARKSVLESGYICAAGIVDRRGLNRPAMVIVNIYGKQISAAINDNFLDAGYHTPDPVALNDLLRIIRKAVIGRVEIGAVDIGADQGTG